MRRLLLLLLPLVLLCACTTAPAEQADAPFSFYYRCAEIAYGSEDGVIRAVGSQTPVCVPSCCNT